MSHPAIHIKSVWKRYDLKATAARPAGEAEAPNLLASADGDDKSVSEGRAFWALRDINLTVQPGEVIGIIGSNGAGKSTLLKILSRVTGPTRGSVRINGSFVSLLEVGSGFHDDLTGRENIFLNATILGMQPDEIRRKFDAIVEFSGVGRFIDIPVKRMSSGMRVRLGFSVAAHAEPQILVVDEILAVGDAEFREKCQERIAWMIGSEKRTVIVVSHNMSSIADLCSRVIVIDAGAIVGEGTPEKMIQLYLESVHGSPKSTFEAPRSAGEAIGNANPTGAAQPSRAITSEVAPSEPALEPERDGRRWRDLTGRVDRTGDGRLRFSGLAVTSGAPSQTTIVSGDEVRFDIAYKSVADVLGHREGTVTIGINDDQHARIFTLISRVASQDKLTLASEGVFTFRVPGLPLIPGNYSVDLGCLIEGHVADQLRGAAIFVVGKSNFYPTGRFPVPTQGRALVRYSWDQPH